MTPASGYGFEGHGQRRQGRGDGVSPTHRGIVMTQAAGVIGAGAERLKFALGRSGLPSRVVAPADDVVLQSQGASVREPARNSVKLAGRRCRLMVSVVPPAEDLVIEL